MAGFDEYGDPIPDEDDRLTGIQGYMLLNGADDNGVDGLYFLNRPEGRSPEFPRQPNPGQSAFVPIRMWAAKIDRRFADVTSSVHYSPDYGVTFSAGIPTGLGMEIRVSGVFHLNSIPQSLITALYDTGSLSHVVLGFDDAHAFFEGDCQVSNFIITTTIDDIIHYSCVVRPYGVFNTLIGATS